ncbi:MAG TPA: fatty acid CoA ligase family protein [Planctomycetota bacterium]|nr:fatty acid CoA ligase family protein [Planctomycetota bacterium]
MTTRQVTDRDASVARYLRERAERTPDALAAAAPRDGDFETWTCRELLAKSRSIAAGLAELGLAPNDRVCVFVRPGLLWLALVHALFQLGAVVVLIDPGMGRRGMLASIARVRPRGLIAVAPVHLARWMNASAFESVEIALTAGRPSLPGVPTLEEILERGRGEFAMLERSARDPAAILFTSGSTGPAKGVLYEHGMFDAQVRMLRELYDFAPGSVDLACFPLFALFGAALDMASVFPHIDFAQPARCDPARIVQAVERFQTRSSFGSPAIWRRVIPWCEARGVRLDSLRSLMIAGAPVEADLVRRTKAVIGAGGEVFTPYGATEALPVAHVEGALLATTLAERAARGEGTCVGRAVPGVELRLIRIGDAPIELWREELLVARGEPGEICVRGANVTREYAFDSEATALAKIADGATTWHRMGDVGQIDDDGRLWFLGRKSQRIETERGLLFPVPWENVAELHPRVGRAALVGAGPRGREIPVLIVETTSGRLPRFLKARAQMAEEIVNSIAELQPLARPERVLFKTSFPLDVRHQAKIDRGALKAWAEERVR